MLKIILKRESFFWNNKITGFIIIIAIVGNSLPLSEAFLIDIFVITCNYLLIILLRDALNIYYSVNMMFIEPDNFLPIKNLSRTFVELKLVFYH